MILIIPLKTSSTSLLIEIHSNTGIIAYLGCQYDKDFIPFYQSNSFYETEISTGIIKLTKDDI